MEDRMMMIIVGAALFLTTLTAFWIG